MVTLIIATSIMRILYYWSGLWLTKFRIDLIQRPFGKLEIPSAIGCHWSNAAARENFLHQTTLLVNPLLGRTLASQKAVRNQDSRCWWRCKAGPGWDLAILPHRKAEASYRTWESLLEQVGSGGALQLWKAIPFRLRCETIDGSGTASNLK